MYFMNVFEHIAQFDVCIRGTLKQIIILVHGYFGIEYCTIHIYGVIRKKPHKVEKRCK